MVIVSGCVLSLWMVDLCFVLMLTCGVILYIIYYIFILYIYIYIYILYYILYYTLLPFSSLLFPFLSQSDLSSVLFSSLFLSFILYVSVLPYTYLYSLLIPSPLIYSHPLFFCPSPSSQSIILTKLLLSYSQSSNIHSIRVGTWICLFIFRQYIFQDNSTPHVLSEWMVEV